MNNVISLYKLYIRTFSLINYKRKDKQDTRRIMNIIKIYHENRKSNVKVCGIAITHTISFFDENRCFRFKKMIKVFINNLNVTLACMNINVFFSLLVLKLPVTFSPFMLQKNTCHILDAEIYLSF